MILNSVAFSYNLKQTITTSGGFFKIELIINIRLSKNIVTFISGPETNLNNFI